MREFLWALWGYVLSPILWVVLLLVVAHVVIGWLISAGTLKRYGPNTRMVLQVTNGVVEPMLKPIRRILPNMGQIDFAPLVLMLLLGFCREYLIPRLILLIPF